MALNENLSNVSAYAYVIDCLFDGPHTVFELHDETGLGMNTIRKLLQQLKRRGRIYIAAWERDTMGRHTLAAYAFGDQHDVRRPAALTSTQRSANRYLRQQNARRSLHSLQGTA